MVRHWRSCRLLITHKNLNISQIKGRVSYSITSAQRDVLAGFDTYQD